MASTLRSPGEARSPSPVPAPSRRDRGLIASCIVLITALAWAYLVHLNRHMTSPIEGDTMMAAMGMVMNQPWGAGDLLLTFVMWAVMMVGMMAVPALPVLILFAGVHAQREDRGVMPAVPSFGLGYLIVWATERKELPLKDVAAAGGWKDVTTLLTCYQHADEATMLKVMASPTNLVSRRTAGAVEKLQQKR
jgi:hypothetical protein